MPRQNRRATSDDDFGRPDLARRISDSVAEPRLGDGHERLPPPDVLILHRKLGGLYMLRSRLRVTVAVRQLLTPFVKPHRATSAWEHLKTEQRHLTIVADCYHKISAAGC